MEFMDAMGVVMIANPKRFAVVNKQSITYDDDGETALVKIPKAYKDALRKVYVLYENDDNGMLLRGIFWNRADAEKEKKSIDQHALYGCIIEEESII